MHTEKQLLCRLGKLVCQIKDRVTADSLLAKAVLCSVSVVKANHVQGGAANRVRREVSISVAAMNGPLW